MSPQTILLLGALLALAVASARWGFGRNNLPEWVRPVADSGVLFILIGAWIGPRGLNLFTVDTLHKLGPLIVIGLGWIGFLFGSHFEWRLMHRYPATLYAAALVESLVTFALVAAGAWGLLAIWPGTALPASQRAAAALILGICASGTAPAGPFQVSSRWLVNHANLNAIRFFAAVDDLPALFLLGAMQAWLHPRLDHSQIPGWQWVALTVVLGLFLGVVAHWVFPGRNDNRHNSLILVGVVSLGAGAAAHLGVSPLLVSALAGMTFANLSHQKESAYGILAEREHSLYAVFLLVAGVLFRFEWGPPLLLVPLYVVVRMAGKLTGGYLGWAFFLGRGRISPLVGGGLMFQGGMALAMAVSFDFSQGGALAHHVTSTIVVAVVANELVAPELAGRLLGRGRAE